MSITTKLDMRGLERLQRELMPKAEALVEKTAFDVQGQAQNRAPVDTGALKASHYTVTRRGGDDLNAVRALVAQLAGPGVSVVAIPRPTDDLVAHVGPSVEYAIFQELGTSKMGAQPFLVPAVEALRKTWRAAWKALFEEMT